MALSLSAFAADLPADQLPRVFEFLINVSLFDVSETVNQEMLAAGIDICTHQSEGMYTPL